MYTHAVKAPGRLWLSPIWVSFVLLLHSLGRCRCCCRRTKSIRNETWSHRLEFIAICAIDSYTERAKCGLLSISRFTIYIPSLLEPSSSNKPAFCSTFLGDWYWQDGFSGIERHRSSTHSKEFHLSVCIPLGCIDAGSSLLHAHTLCISSSDTSRHFFFVALHLIDKNLILELCSQWFAHLFLKLENLILSSIKSTCTQLISWLLFETSDFSSIQYIWSSRRKCGNSRAHIVLWAPHNFHFIHRATKASLREIMSIVLLSARLFTLIPDDDGVVPRNRIVNARILCSRGSIVR